MIGAVAGLSDREVMRVAEVDNKIEEIKTKHNKLLKKMKIARAKLRENWLKVPTDVLAVLDKQVNEMVDKLAKLRERHDILVRLRDSGALDEADEAEL